MLEMILLELLVPQRKVLVVQEIVCHVVACVAEDSTGKNRRGDVPVVRENKVCEVPERPGQHEEKCRRKHESVLVHGKVMVDAMQSEVKCDSHSVVGQIATQKAVVSILNK